MHAFPLHPPADVLVLGASSASGGAALELRSAGYPALVAGNRSCLGEGTAGRLALDGTGMDRSDPAVRRIIPEFGKD